MEQLSEEVREIMKKCREIAMSAGFNSNNLETKITYKLKELYSPFDCFFIINGQILNPVEADLIFPYKTPSLYCCLS